MGGVMASSGLGDLNAGIWPNYGVEIRRYVCPGGRPEPSRACGDNTALTSGALPAHSTSSRPT